MWGFSLGSKAITDSLKRQFEVVDVVRRVATFGIFVCVAVAVNETQSQLEFESESESEILSKTEPVRFEGFQVDGKCREVSECRLSHMRENSKDFLWN